MPASQPDHPSPRQLESYRLGSTSPDETAWISNHLLGCETCRRQVEDQPDDSVLQRRGPVPGHGTHPAGGPGPEDGATSLDSAVRDVPPELKSLGKYEILGKLGEGGMGAVWKARHQFLGNHVAIKVMRPQFVTQKEARERFLMEMRAAGRLQHRHIVRGFDAEEAGDLLLLVMEYVEGISLEKLVVKKGPLPICFACRCIVQAAEGLQHAHEKGMAHRDVKPANLMVTREKVLKVLDFGLARLPRDSASQGGPTQADTFMGTPEFVSPEQATDAATADIRSDIYSLGCTLYFLLTAMPPFRGQSVMDTLLAQVQDDPPPIRGLRPEVPEELWLVLAKMLAKNPEDRYPTPAELVAALEPFAQSGKQTERDTLELPPPVPEPILRRPVMKPNRKNRRLMIGWLMGSGLLLACLAIPLILEPGATESSPPSRQADPAKGEGRVAVGPVPGGVDKGDEKPKDGKRVSPTTSKGTPAPNPEKLAVSPPGGTPPSGGEKKGDARAPLAALPPGFVDLFNRTDLKGWKTAPGEPKAWSVDSEGNLVGKGATTYLFSERSDYRNVHVRAEVMINDGGNSGVILGAKFDPQAIPRLLEADINSTHNFQVKTGGLVIDRQFVLAGKPPRPGVWFTLEVVLASHHVIVKVDGTETNNLWLYGASRNHPPGHLALQLYTKESVVKYRRIAVRELPAKDPAQEKPASIVSFEANPLAFVTSRPWSMARQERKTGKRSIIHKKVGLAPSGVIRGINHPNEVSWELQGHQLIFRGQKGGVTTIFDKVLVRNGRFTLMGWHRDQSTIHFLITPMP